MILLLYCWIKLNDLIIIHLAAMWRFLKSSKMTVFYIKYKHLVPTSIHTEYGRGPNGDLPLLTVGDLIVAYKIAVAPVLDKFSVAQLTLHFTFDGPCIRNGKTLDSFDTSVDGTFGNPFFIHQSNQFYSSILVKTPYMGHLPDYGSSSAVAAVQQPTVTLVESAKTWTEWFTWFYGVTIILRLEVIKIIGY